jgi:hypothetical protein
MLTLKSSLLSLLILAVLLSAVVAQEATNPTKDFLVTGSVNGGRLRVTAPSSVVQIRMEVYDSTGKRIFDTKVNGGNLLDWPLQDAQARPLADDTYLCVLTLKSLSGKLSRSFGSVKVENGSVNLQAVDSSQARAQQSQESKPVDENISLTVLKEDENQTTAVIAHNGDEGQITRGRGALSFRMGDFFSGKDIEQMRLTPEGNVGIGIAHPQVRLEVDGLIRATLGIVFPDGSVQFSAARKTFGPASLKPGQFDQNSPFGQEHVEPQVSGTGTQDHLARWLDNAGTLGDSAIVDVNGSIGIGTPIPQSGLDYHNAQAPFFTRDFPTNPGNAVAGLQLGLSNAGSRNAGVGPSFLFFAENSAGAKSFLGRVSGVWENPTAGAEAGAIFFQVRANSGDLNALTERMRITAAGNVGIGTMTPGAKLEIGGNALIYPPSGPGSFHIRNRTVSDFSQIVFDDHVNAYRGYIGYIGPSAGLGARNDTVEFGTQFNDITFRPNEVEAMRLTSTGRLGIGLSNPSDKLHVSGTGIIRALVNSDSNAGLGLSLGGSQKWSVATTSPGNFQIFNDAIGQNALSIDGANRVGIGTTTPQARLDVRGDVKLGSTGQLFASGGEENLKIIRGIVDGINGQVTHGSGFTVEHLDHGVYVINFDTPFSEVPTVTVTCGQAPCIPTTTFLNNSDLTIKTFALNGNLMDVFFQMIAIGPR